MSVTDVKVFVESL